MEQDPRKIRRKLRRMGWRKRREYINKIFSEQLAKELREEHPDLRPGKVAMDLIRKKVEGREPSPQNQEVLISMVWNILFPGIEPPEIKTQSLF
ncbi:MAG: hypothetical protein ABIM88_03780 [candidate division WOR-3 bacterium]